MPKLKKFVFFLGICFLFIFVVAIGIINTQGKDFVEDQLQSSLNKSVVIDKLSYAFPIGIQAEGVSVDDMFTAKTIDAQVEITSINASAVKFHSVNVNAPVINIKNASSNPQAIIKKIEDKTNAAEKAVKTDNVKEQSPKNILIKRVAISDGIINYSDDKGKKLEFSIEDVYLSLSDFTLPLQDAKASFQLSGRLNKENSPFADSNVSASGWINWLKRNMDGQLKLQDQSGSAGLSADLKSENNDMHVQGRMKVKNFVSAPEKKTNSINNIILSALSGLDVDSQFSFQTQMDDIEIGAIKFTGNVGVRE